MSHCIIGLIVNENENAKIELSYVECLKLLFHLLFTKAYTFSKSYDCNTPIRPKVGPNHDTKN